MTQTVRFLLLSAATAVTTALVLLVLPSEVDTLWTFLAYLVPFVLATEAVAVLPRHWVPPGRLAAAVGVVVFLVVYAGFVPMMFGTFLDGDFAAFYELVRFFTPYLILALALLFRLGGGGGATVRRLCYAGILLMLSGLEDLMYWLWQGQAPPQRWDWADHLTVRLGHVASLTEAMVVMTIHLVLAVLVLVLPFRRRRPDPSA